MLFLFFYIVFLFFYIQHPTPLLQTPVNQTLRAGEMLEGQRGRLSECICLSVCVCVCVCVYLSVYMFLFLIYLPTYIFSVCLPTLLSLSVCLCIHLPLNKITYLCVYRAEYLPVPMHIMAVRK